MKISKDQKKSKNKKYPDLGCFEVIRVAFNLAGFS